MIIVVGGGVKVPPPPPDLSLGFKKSICLVWIFFKLQLHHLSAVFLESQQETVDVATRGCLSVTQGLFYVCC